MAFTKKDVEILRTVIREETQPQFDLLRKEMYGLIEGLRIYMDTRFRSLEHKIDSHIKNDHGSMTF